MKIVLISSGVLPVPPVGYGGLEQVIYDLAWGLDQLGHEVCIIAPSESKPPGNVKLIDCGPCIQSAPQWELEAYNKYRPMMDSVEFQDVIWHDHSWRKMTYIAKMENPRLRVMSTLHGMLPYQKPPPIPRPCMAGISKSHADLMSGGLGIPVRYVYNGIDLGKYPFNRGLRNDRYLFLARITAFKGPHVFVDLMKQMRKKGDVVGDDQLVEDKEYVEKVLMQVNDYPECRYWGPVPRERAAEMFREFKCYVLPCTKGWEEPFGLTVIEAAASGCPTVATASGAIPELIDEGVSGYVAKTTFDLKDLLTDEKLASISPEDCRKQAEKFSRERMTQGYLALYSEVLCGGW